MPYSAPVDGFRLAYSDTGDREAPAVVLLHGWPGGASDYRLVAPLLARDHRVVVPHLRGFGDSDRHLLDPDRYYSAPAQARSITALVDELGLGAPVIGGYDIGSRFAQAIARENPEKVTGLAISPPLPGPGRRVLEPTVAPEIWYQYFHRSPLSVGLLDGRRDAVRAYLHHFWTHWSGPGFEVDTPEFEALVDDYSRPGAFESASNWYRAGAGYFANAVAERAPAPEDRISVPTHALWQQLDPLFPQDWADRLEEFFADVTVHRVDGIGHFTPLEAPGLFADLVRAAGRPAPSGRDRRTTATVRPARPEDDRALAVLDASAWPPELQVAPPQPATEPFFGPRRRVEDVLVAVVGGEVVGYIRTGRHMPMDNNRHVVHIDALAVDPAARGAGAGSALVGAAIDTARAAGFRKLGLRALSTNTRAIALYRRHGFREEGRLAEEIRLPDGSYADDVWFARAV